MTKISKTYAMFFRFLILLNLLGALQACFQADSPIDDNQETETSTFPVIQSKKISGDTSAFHTRPHLIYNSAGDGLAVWIVEGKHRNNRVLASVYDALTQQWQDEVILDTEGYTRDVYLASSGDTFLVVWEENFYISAKMFNTQSGEWSESKYLNQNISTENNTGEIPAFPLRQIAIAGNGSGFLVSWVEGYSTMNQDGERISTNRIKARQWLPANQGGTWNGETLVAVTENSNLQIALSDSSNNYLLSWLDTSAADSNIMTRKLISESDEWLEPELVYSTEQSIKKLLQAANETQNVIAWVQVAETGAEIYALTARNTN
ncbi:MAG: hypothetical protein R3240_13675, partial [Gammaproteobacteria bacterium]|nr:hypothetical protein [Gammaproteobacteria bacterium]